MFTATDPQVAIVTATRLLPNRLAYLELLHASLEAQDVPFEWILSLDGADPELVPPRIAADRRVKILPLPRPVGAATARNLAINHISAPYVTFSDDDDLLPQESIAVRYQHARETGLGWVAAWSADLLPDGSTRTWECPTPPGRHEPGDVWTYWRTPESTIPLGPTTLLVRTELLQAAGGFGGLVQGEDYMMILGVTGLSAGELLPVVSYLYRKHDHQMTRGQGYLTLEGDARRFSWAYGAQLRRAVRGVSTLGSAAA
ncbi:glycosyltransferase family 2 protein [Streptomyces luteireticuli]|uniref:glycosyltransferase family 2 protein n=1 Tax=Streptomyces luteireticuli TaxID=173858 RepID=UPI003557C8F5